MKDCGQADGLKYRFCVPTKDECPINDLKIIGKENPPLEGYKVLQLETKSLYFSNSNSYKLPAIESRIMPRFYALFFWFVFTNPQQ